MSEDRVFRGVNYTGFHAGSKEEWAHYKLARPDVPMPTRGKLFLKKYLETPGLEISLNVVPPGKGIPFLHRHEQNDEVYIVIGGAGQFQVDGECIDVCEGSVLRMKPAAARAFRNTSDVPLYFLCVQYDSASTIEGGTKDGQVVDTSLVWPDSHSGTVFETPSSQTDDRLA